MIARFHAPEVAVRVGIVVVAVVGMCAQTNAFLIRSSVYCAKSKLQLALFYLLLNSYKSTHKIKIE